MTNEKSDAYMSELKRQVQNVLGERYLLKTFGYYNDDGIEHFQLMRTLGDFAYLPQLVTSSNVT